MYRLLKQVFFRIEPERIHYQAMHWLSALYRFPPTRFLLKRLFTHQDVRLERELWGLHFRNPVGLAAGFDKDARYTDPLAALGFGFVEIGTVTPLPQPGNPQPRLFRLPTDDALINRMGFNNGGVDAAAARLQHRKEKIIIGGNIGKNKDTPNERAVDDYIVCFKALYPHVDYFVVNVSSPNTPGLRALQDRQPLTALLLQLQQLNKDLGEKPLLLKIAPDLTNDQLDDMIAIVAETGIHGVVATNTTIERGDLNTPTDVLHAIGQGGLSGKPLRERSTDVVRYLHSRSRGAFPIIAVGGVFDAADAREKLDAGAALVQVYTGFIYKGPGIAAKICRGLARLC